MPTDFLSLFAALTARKVRFVIVGGLAVLLHGIDRVTADVDLAIDLAPEAARDAIEALTGLGLRAMAPVDPLQFADKSIRQRWLTERNMQVFSLWDPSHQRPTVDLFVAPPIDFTELWRDSVILNVGGMAVHVASISHLIQMKTAVGRAKDLDDVVRLKLLSAKGRQQ